MALVQASCGPPGVHVPMLCARAGLLVVLESGQASNPCLFTDVQEWQPDTLTWEWPSNPTEFSECAWGWAVLEGCRLAPAHTFTHRPNTFPSVQKLNCHFALPSPTHHSRLRQGAAPRR